MSHDAGLYPCDDGWFATCSCGYTTDPEERHGAALALLAGHLRMTSAPRPKDVPADGR